MEEGFRVLTARGSELERGFPFGVADLLCEHVVWDEDQARVRAALRSLDGFEPFVLAA